MFVIRVAQIRSRPMLRCLFSDTSVCILDALVENKSTTLAAMVSDLNKKKPPKKDGLQILLKSI